VETKILIIKLGYSETLDSEIGKTPSLGDVLRTTPILSALKEKHENSHITWLVSKQAEPLLHGNRFINRILVWDEFVPFQLMREKFDVLINLEKISGIAALSDMIDAWTKYGFRFEGVYGNYHAYERGLTFIDYIEEKKKSNRAKDFWQKVLIEMIGVKWKAQEYVIGYDPGTEPIYDVGLNYKVGSKWPTKAMSEDRWRVLGNRLIGAGLKISWQEGLEDLYSYMDWINSNRLIITQDSLGLHLAFALKKKVIGIFGPTDAKEVHLYGGAKAITSSAKCKYIPCYSSECLSGMNCMDIMNIDEIIESVKHILEKEEMEVVA
jgi:heptosyltransferase-2